MKTTTSTYDLYQVSVADVRVKSKQQLIITYYFYSLRRNKKSINYYLSITYVFSSGIKFKKKEEFLLVFVMSFFGLIFNQVFIYILYKFALINLFYSKLITTGVVFFWNYNSRRYIIFRWWHKKLLFLIFRTRHLWRVTNWTSSIK